MLAVEHRLRRRDEFAAVVKTGRRAGRGCLVVHVLAKDRRPDDPQVGVAVPGSESTQVTAAAGEAVRVGFVVPRAVGNAVARNKVRRRLRHLVRDRLDLIPPGTDVVVRVSPGAPARSYAQLGADLTAAVDAAMAARTHSRVRKARSST